MHDDSESIISKDTVDTAARIQVLESTDMNQIPLEN